MQYLAESLRELWDQPLYQAGDSPVLFNQLVVALLVTAVGIWLVRRGLQSLGRFLRTRSKVTPQGAYTVQKLAAFVAYPVVILLALPVAGIPVTIFAVLGGAVAIGLGFGAQNLLNNLISGVIIIIEQPIRVGDIVELESERGRVEDIGGRCVRIRRYDGVHVLVPNSYFLEQRVVNWTLISSDVRGTVSVGVAYGSSVALVRELMLQAAREYGKLREYPPPEVLFADFGDNALVFTLYFWTDISAPMDLRRTQSELRVRIAELFSASGVVVAFPQRDVHLTTGGALSVQLVSSSDNPVDRKS